MRYAIVSDIHANLPAWKTVLTDIADMRVDKIVCLGDVVGYGTDPVGVLESVYHVVHATLMGNHDAAVCGKLDPEAFSPRARAAVMRHREQISARGLNWLSNLPLVLKASGFQCTHGDFSEPAAFRYIIEPPEALASWNATKEQLLFVGHSHLPGIYVIGPSGVPHFVNACDFTLEEGKRYIVNPGSVGYPRVGDCRSCYCVFDDAEKTINYRTVPFDCAGYRKALREAGFEDDPWLELKETERHLPTLRARLSFAKPLTAAQHAHDVRKKSHIGAARLRKPLLFALAVAACAAGAAAFAVYRAEGTATDAPFAIHVPDYDIPSLNAYPLVPADKNMLPALPTLIGPDGRLSGWRYDLQDRGSQLLDTGLRDGAITLRANHTKARELRLESPLINLSGTKLRSLRLSGRTHRLDSFAGSVSFQLVTYAALPDQTLEQRAVFSHELRGSKGKNDSIGSLSRKINLPKSTTHVRFRMLADFKGTLDLEQPTLTADDAPARAAPPTKKGTP